MVNISQRIHILGHQVTYLKFSGPLNDSGVRGTGPLQNPSITLDSALRICGSASMGSTNRGSCRTIIHIYLKKSMYKWTCGVQTCCSRVNCMIDFVFLAVPHAGSQFPGQRSNRRHLLWKCRVQTTGPPGKSLYI